MSGTYERLIIYGKVEPRIPKFPLAFILLVTTLVAEWPPPDGCDERSQERKDRGE